MPAQKEFTVPTRIENPKEIARTLVVCLVWDANYNRLDMLHYERTGQHTEPEATKVYEYIKDPQDDPINHNWSKANHSGTTLHGNTPTLIYFMTQANGWRFASKARVALTFKKPVDSFFYDYDFVDIAGYRSNIISVKCDRTFVGNQYPFNLHCELEIGQDNWVEVVIDPRWENP